MQIVYLSIFVLNLKKVKIIRLVFKKSYISIVKFNSNNVYKEQFLWQVLKI
jgi:hypothetical protein